LYALQLARELKLYTEDHPLTMNTVHYTTVLTANQEIYQEILVFVGNML